MNYVQRAWHSTFVEPLAWLFYAFFQPARFKREYESKGIVNRIVIMLRLALPMFLCAYPLALLLHLLWAILPTKVAALLLINSEAVNPMTLHALPAIAQFLVAIALAILVSIMWSLLWGIATGIRGGIAWGLVLSMVGGITFFSIRGDRVVVSSIFPSFENSIMNGLLLSILFGVVGSIIGIIARFIIVRRGIGKDIVSGLLGGMVGSIAGGIVGALIADIVTSIIGNKLPEMRLTDMLYVASLAGTLAGGIAGSIAKPVAEKKGGGVVVLVIVAAIMGAIAGGFGGIGWGWLLSILHWSLWEWVGMIVGGIVVGSIAGIVGAIVLDIVEVGDRRKNTSTALMILIAGGLYFGITSISLTSGMGIVMTCAMGLILGIVRPSTLSLVLAIQLGIGRLENANFPISNSLLINLVLIMSFIIGYYRLPLYLFSSVSTARAYLYSRKNPSQVFARLRRSSLYWDERAVFPLPMLKEMLVLAARQHVENTAKEVAFIIAERREQIDAAQVASLEIAILYLEECQKLPEIALASQRLTDILQEAELIDPQRVAPFAHLHDASRDAARANSPLGWQAKRSALQEMLANLKKVHPHTAFRDTELNARLGIIVAVWQREAEQRLETLERAPERTSRIDNPYNPGQILELHDSRFVGRRDLAQRLEEALSRGRNRPTFLLYGERRMGKSSTLKQLPDLLGARYLPIYCDMQSRGFSASTAIFLGKIADEVTKAMHMRGLLTRKLSYEQLQDASKRSQTEVYYQFERWLELLEPLLEQADRTLLLTFDEFEKLEDAGLRKDIDLDLLLDWFRSIIQHHPHVALLFSGVHTFSEMGENWASYFVNVQTLKVSFLQRDEAYQLITQPIPDFPGQSLFAERVVDAIMQVTNCHPFLVQALCSALIDDLNTSKRSRIELPDVVAAADHVLKNWGDTYFRDLWARTDQEQRACIIALSLPGKSSLLMIEQRSGLERDRVCTALDTLIERDIVVYEQGIYRIPVHLFRYWVERSKR